MDHYSTLGISKNASDEDIKRAYRKLAMKHHPDRGGDQTQFQKIQEAYDTLSDPHKRSEYDNPQAQGFQGHPNGFQFNFGGGDPFQDIFAQFGFGAGHPFSHMHHQRKNKDLRVELVVDIASTMSDQTKTISVQTTNGQRQTVQVNIPRGVRTGNTMRFGGLGDNMFDTIPRGDLYVHFIVPDDHNYRIEGDDLIYVCRISCLDAMSGTTAEIPTLENKIFRISIAAGSKHGTRLRIPNQGLYALNSSMRGHLYVELDLIVPALQDLQVLALLDQIKSRL